MAWWIIWLATCVLLVNSEASIYDDDYDAYTRTYDYKTAGKLDVFTYDIQKVGVCNWLSPIIRTYTSLR